VDYDRAGMVDTAVWVLVHDAGDAAAARVLARVSAGRIALARTPYPASDVQRALREYSLRMRLALARCDVAEGRSEREPLAALAAAMDYLESRSRVYDRLVEQWAVATAESMRRYDQAALLFAAAVRGRRGGAAQRWTDWAARVLHSEITLPDLPPDGRRDARDRHRDARDRHRDAARALI